MKYCRFFSLVFILALSIQAKETVTIGILSFRPAQVTLKEWEPLQTYLNTRLSNYHFEIRPLTQVELSVAVKAKDVDFILTNPASYLFFREKNLVKIPFATMLDIKNSLPMQEFGGVIFSRKDEKNINRLEDLKGKKIATVGTDSLGGYQMQAYELFKVGIDTIKDTELIFTEMPHDNTVYEVLHKNADVGFVRTSLLEQMAQEKKINLQELQIIHPQNNNDFPFLLSTALYPEWPIAGLLHVSNRVTTELSAALLSMPDMRSSGLGGFSVAQDYEGVKNILQTMHFPPFNQQNVFDFQSFIEPYIIWIIIFGLIIFAFMSVVLSKLFQNNKKLRSHYQTLTHFEKIFQNTHEAIFIASPNAFFLEINAAFTQITGYTKEEVIGKKTNILKSGKHDDAFYASIWQALEHEGFWQGEIYNRRKNGELYAEFLSINVIYDAQRNVEKFIGTFYDISKLKANQKKLEEIAYFDPLTNLPNRRMLLEKLNELMTKTSAQPIPFTLLYIDIDGFKNLNDKYGHHFGDEFLLVFTKRMHNIFKKTDLMARIGGDEFIVVLPSLHEKKYVLEILGRVLQTGAQTVQIEKHNVGVSVSIGVTHYPQELSLSAEKLLQQADQAMYQAKVSGKNQFCFYDMQTAKNLLVHHENIDNIAHALRTKQFVVYYQPKVAMQSGKLLGFEALVRWQHPKEGILSPFRFLPFIENDPLMIQLGEFVLEEVLIQLQTWQNAWNHKIHVSVNLSAYQMLRDDFVPNLKAVLARHPQVDTSSLEFEILETSALEDMNVASNVIAECRKMGISFSLDDFGTGYSSLTYLKRLDIQMIKIDQNFVRELSAHSDNIMILDAIIGLAASFGIDVIAEGVETLRQGRILLYLGCTNAQGYFIAKPMDAKAVMSWYNEWNAPSQWRQTKQIKHENISVLYSLLEKSIWVDKLTAYIEETSSFLPELDHQSCQFAHMLQEDKNLVAMLEEILPFHEHLHILARELVLLSQAGQKTEAVNRIGELHESAAKMEDTIYTILARHELGTD